jgi:hypothetical protein
MATSQTPLCYAAGVSLRAPAAFTPSIGLELAGVATRPALDATMHGVAGAHPLLGQWQWAAAREVSLAPIGTVDFPWLVLGPLGWVFSKQLDQLFGGINIDPFGAVTKAIAGVLADVGNIIGGIPVQLGNWAVTAATSGAALLGGLVKAGIDAGANLLKPAFAAGATTVGLLVNAAVQAGGNVVSAGINAGANALAVPIHAGLSILSAAGSAVSNAITFAGRELTAARDAVLGALLHAGEAVWGLITGIPQWIVNNALPFVEMVAEWIKVHILDPIGKVATDAAHWAFDQMAGVGQGDPEAVMGVAAGLVAAAIPFGIAAHLLGNAAEVAHPLKSMGFTLTARALVDLTNIGKISEATIGVGYALALGHPMEYWLSRRIRWRIPDDRNLLESYTKRDISEGETDLALAYHGYNEARIQALKESAWHEPRPFELRRLMDSGVVPVAWLKAKLRRNMLRDEDVDVMAAALGHNQYSTQRGELWSAAWSLLRDGASTPARFAADVGPLAMPADQIALGVRAAALQHAADLVNFQTTTLLTAAVDGQITVDELGIALNALGMVADRVKAEQARARVRIAGKVTAKAPGADTALLAKLQTEQTTLWVQRFRRGLVDVDGLYTNLVAIGLDPSIAQVTVDLEVARQTPLVPIVPDRSSIDLLAETLETFQHAYVDQFRAGLIDATTLLDDLLAAGVDPDVAQAIAIDEQARAYTPPQTTPSPAEEAEARKVLAAQTAYLRDQFRAGYIDAATYRDGLVAAGVDPELASIDVEREVLRAKIAAAK